MIYQQVNHILIVGPPAAGKTLVRRALFTVISKILRNTIELSLDNVLRENLRLSSQKSEHYYDDSGALILLNPKSQIYNAMNDLISQCNLTSQSNHVIVEVPSENISKTISRFGRNFLKNTIVIYLVCPQKIREEKNKMRGAASVPDHVMDSYIYPSTPTPSLMKCIEEYCSKLIVLDTSSSINNLWINLEKIVREIFHLKNCKLPIPSYEQIDNKDISEVIIVCNYNEKWLFVRNKNELKYELPGGKRERGESILQASMRELEEETGAIQYEIWAIDTYKYILNDQIHLGKLFFARINILGQLPDNEISEFVLCDSLPSELRYPFQTGLFFEQVKTHLPKLHLGLQSELLADAVIPPFLGSLPEYVGA